MLGDITDRLQDPKVDDVVRAVLTQVFPEFERSLRHGQAGARFAYLDVGNEHQIDESMLALWNEVSGLTKKLRVDQKEGKLYVVAKPQKYLAGEATDTPTTYPTDSIPAKIMMGPTNETENALLERFDPEGSYVTMRLEDEFMHLSGGHTFRLMIDFHVQDAQGRYVLKKLRDSEDTYVKYHPTQATLLTAQDEIVPAQESYLRNSNLGGDVHVNARLPDLEGISTLEIPRDAGLRLFFLTAAHLMQYRKPTFSEEAAGRPPVADMPLRA